MPSVGDSSMFPSARQSFLVGDLQWDSMVPRLLLMTSEFAEEFNAFTSTYSTYADLPPEEIVGMSADMQALFVSPLPTSEAGWAKSKPAVFSQLTSLSKQPSIEGAILMEYNSVALENSRLISYHKGAQGFNFRPTGYDYVVWHQSSDPGWFRL